MAAAKLRDRWVRQRSRRFALIMASLGILAGGLPSLLQVGPAELSAVLPLIVGAVLMTLIGARYARGLSAAIVLTAILPLIYARGEEAAGAVRNALFVSAGTWALTWAHVRQHRRLQQRARARRRVVGRAKSKAKQWQRTGSQLRRAVERSEVAQQTLLEHLPVHVLRKDLDGRFTFASQSFGVLLGIDVKDILGRTDYDFFDKAIADKFRQDDQRIARDGSMIDDVERTQLPDGSVAFMQVRKAPLRDAHGIIVGVQGIFWDVTEALSGRAQLQRIESWAHALTQAALDAVLIVDVQGRVLEANPAVETILGYRHHVECPHPPLGDIMRTSENDFVAADTDNSAGDNRSNPNKPERGSLSALLKRATGRRIEVRLRRPDDTWFEAEISAHPLVVEDSSGWAIFIRDITRRKQSVSELRAAKEAAERANLAKSEFVANVSHELRTPLTGIVGLHGLLEGSELDEQQREYLALAKSSSDNLLSLIDALLDFSKIEAQRLELEHDCFELLDCVEDAAGSLAARAQIRGLELVIDLAPDLPLTVVGDQQRLRQVLLNLIGNAIKFTLRGDIIVRVTSLGVASPTVSNHSPTSDIATPGAESLNIQSIRFEVIDAGIGIAQEAQAFIFEAFQQADSSTTRRYGGTGLGLAICRELVHLMGGEITVTSELGQGSTFTVTLPLNAPTADSSAEVTAKPHLLPGTVIAMVAQPTAWRDVLHRDLLSMGGDVQCISKEQLLAREPANLFAAGNHTILLADFRELLVGQEASLPVVERVVLAVPLAFARPSLTPRWLRHSDFHWLPRPIRRAELQRVLQDGNETEKLSRYEEDAEPSIHRTLTILLVEDSPINQTVLKGMLEQLGHEVTLASNGGEAVIKTIDGSFDAVLMDIQMPDVDGLEATRRIRNYETSANVSPAYIIALTAHAMPSDREQARAAGMNGFLLKPIPIDALRKAMDTVPIDDAPRHFDANLPPALASESAYARADATMDNSPIEVAALPAPDWEKLSELLGDNMALAREVVELLRAEAPRLMRLLRASCLASDQREARRASHTLKSNLRNLGLDGPAQLAGQIEGWTLEGDWHSIHTAVLRLEHEVNLVVCWCDEMLAIESEPPR